MNETKEIKTRNRAPARLDQVGREKWKEIFPQFENLNAMELEMLIQYCQQYAIYIRAQHEIDQAPELATVAKNGASCPIGAIAIQSKAIDQMRRIYTALQKAKRFKNNEILDEDFPI